ncbi:PTS fructose transporter subunit IIC [bacterium]|nr:PTS fructose transporter subunit IIC [bacterium]
MSDSPVTESLKKLRQYLLTGVSYAIPFVAAGGILIALALAFAPKGADNAPDPSGSHVLSTMLTIGVAAFSLLLPILGGYISYAIAGRPGLVPGFVGGFLCNHIPVQNPVEGAPTEVSTGFLGALVIGLLAGWIVNQIKKIPAGKILKPIMPILIIPILSSVFVGLLVLMVIGNPIADMMLSLGNWLETMGTGNQVVLAMILGAMIAFDMGGPVNKAAFFFGLGMIQQENYAIMGAVAAAICTPPLGMGLATMLQKKLWKEEEREAGIAGLAMGMIGITEGAIPFAAADPLKVIPSIIVGSMVASTIAMLSGVGDHAPHGGPIVIPVVDNKIMYVVAIIVGTFVTAMMINALKTISQRNAKQDEEQAATAAG